MSESSSPFAQPAPDLRIKEGAPAIARPSKEEVEAFPAEGVKLLDKNRNAQQAVADRYNVDWAKGKHFVIAGGTGLGIGCSVATAAMNLVAKSGSLTVIARDLSKSLGYATGAEMEIRAKDAGMGGRFAWINDGVGLEGKTLDTIVNALNGMDAQDVFDLYFKKNKLNHDRQSQGYKEGTYNKYENGVEDNVTHVLNKS